MFDVLVIVSSFAKKLVSWTKICHLLNLQLTKTSTINISFIVSASPAETMKLMLIAILAIPVSAVRAIQEKNSALDIQECACVSKVGKPWGYQWFYMQVSNGPYRLTMWHTGVSVAVSLTPVLMQ